MSSFFEPDVFTAARERLGVIWGRPVHVLETTTSTNDRALEALATDTKTGAVWLAQEQTSGRGRRGNEWKSAPGENLTMSLLLRVPGPSARLVGLSLVVGLAVREVVAQVVPESSVVQVKWPNDVFVDDRKCAGILIETRALEGDEFGVVVGIGLNVLTRDFPPELTHATSLLAAGAPVERLGFEELLARLLFEIELRTKTFLPRGLEPFLSDLQRHDCLRGKRIRVDEREGTGAGIDVSGALLLQDDDGQVVSLASGHVERCA